MSDFDTFTSKPSKSDLDDTSCRYNGCDFEASQVLRCRDPKEWIPYCEEHAKEINGRFGARSRQRFK